MDKKLFLHIGIEKTGTSAIQNNLYCNRKFLKKNNFCYSEIGLWHDRSHHGIAFSISEISEFGLEINLTKENMLNEVIKDYQVSGCSNLIISSEILKNFCYNQNCTWFLNEMKLVFDEIKIIIYLRRQDRWLSSLYNQYIKDPITHYNGSFEYFSKEMEVSANYYNLLKDWEGIVGFENIHIILYKEFITDYKNGIKDFLLLLDINFDNEFIFNNEKLNISMNAIQLRIIKKINLYHIESNDRKEINDFIIEALSNVDYISCFEAIKFRIIKKINIYDIENNDKKEINNFIIETLSNVGCSSFFEPSIDTKNLMYKYRDSNIKLFNLYNIEYVW